MIARIFNGCCSRDVLLGARKQVYLRLNWEYSFLPGAGHLDWPSAGDWFHSIVLKSYENNQ